MAMCSYGPRSVAMCDYWRVCVAMPVAMGGYVWLWVALFSVMWLCMSMGGYVWLWVAMYGYG